MTNKLIKKDIDTGKKWKTLGVNIERDKYDSIVERLSVIASTTVSKSGKLGVTNADVIEQFLDDHVSNIDLKDFISRDFHEQSSEQNRRLNDLTTAVNTLTLCVENLRNVFALMSTSGDVKAALSLINNMTNRALVEQQSTADDFEFTTTSGAEVEPEDDSLIAAFDQIKVSDPSEKSTAFGAGLVTNFGSLTESKNIHKSRKGR